MRIVSSDGRYHALRYASFEWDLEGGVTETAAVEAVVELLVLRTRAENDFFALDRVNRLRRNEGPGYDLP